MNGRLKVTDAALMRIGAELRRYREDAGLSGSAVARELGWSQPKVSRVETGRFAASLEEIATLLDYYGAPEEVRAELLATVGRREGLAGAWVVRAGGTRRRHGELRSIEQRATRLRQHHGLMVPGLLQTRRYARGVADALGFTESDAIAARRVTRQDAFISEGTARYEVVLDARALMRWPGESAVMAEQLQHLADVDSDRVDLRILLPGGEAAAFAIAGFLIYDFTDNRPSVVMLESLTADTYLSDEVDISAYASTFERLQNDALDVEASRQYLVTTLRNLRGTKG